MKKLLLTSMLLLILVSFLYSQTTYNVTFQLNTSTRLDTIVPTSMVQIRGNTAPLTWGDDSPLMTNIGGDYWQVTHAFPEGTNLQVQYYATSWEDMDNTTITVTQDTVLPLRYFKRGFNDPPYVPSDSIDVWFRVNVAGVTGFDPAIHTPGVRGGTAPLDWGSSLLLTREGTSMFYSGVARFPNSAAGTSVDYKFHIGGTGGAGWEDITPSNRTFNLNNDTTLVWQWFSNKRPSPLPKVNVTFKVNMSVKMKEGQFTPATQNVFVRGNFNGWSTADQMTDADADSIYEKTIANLDVGSTAKFKYYFESPPTWESDPDRVYIVPDVDSEFLDYFDRDSVVTMTGSGNILFQVDMSVMTEIGIFDPVNDKLQVRGSFNGWGDSDPTRSHMSADPLDPNFWYLNVPFTNVGINEPQYYKYYVNLKTPGIWTDGWERPCSRGGGNREVPFFAQPNQEAPISFYDDIKPDWVITTGKNVQAVFRVNMKPAMSTAVQPIPFNPALDTVYWIGEQPSFVRSQGWVDSDQMRVLRLTDPDGDSIYTATLTVLPPSFNSFVYRYAYVSGTDGAWYREPAGYGAFAYRVRYVGQDAARSFPVIPWIMPIDTWTNREVKPDQETDPYTSYLYVRENDIVPMAYNLSQNYPNPFNPVTNISFNIPIAGLVTIKVYNILGQEVSTLLNEEMKPGNYRVKFDATNLPSGVYFYRMQAGDVSLTKKLMVLK